MWEPVLGVLWTLLPLVLIGVLFHLAKAFGVASPSWHLAKAEVVRLKKEQPAGQGGLPDEAERVLGGGGSQWSYFLLWNGQREMAAWRLIHAAERQLAKNFDDLRVRARLKRGLGELEELSEGKAQVWRECLRRALCQEGEEGLEGRRALLQEFLADLYNARDTRYARLLTLHNKGTYLLWLGLLVAAALILLWKSFLMEVFGSAQPLFLFLAGFGGGLLSRLLRVVRTDRLPTDYGAYWVPLFLSPVLGGLAALLGVLVVELGVGLKLLGEGVAGLLQPPSVYGLGVVLAFSERLFQGLSQGVEDRLLPPPGKGGGSPAPPPPAGGTPGGAGSTGGGPKCHPSVGQGKGQGGDGNSLPSVPEEMPSRR